MELKHLNNIEAPLNKQIKENKKKGHSEAFKKEAKKWGVKKPDRRYRITMPKPAPWLVGEPGSKERRQAIKKYKQ